MRAARLVAGLLGLFVIAVSAGAVQARTARTAAIHPGAERLSQTPHIYLLKGLADVFSSGMDTLAAKLRARGIVARVASHASSDSLADELIAEYRAGAHGPIVICGHSLGADAAVSMAQRLNAARIPVKLVITFGLLGYPHVPGNVARATNFYQSDSAWHGQLVRGPGFRGPMNNVNLDNAPGVNHFNIEKVDLTQNQAVAQIVAAIGASRPAAPKPETRTAQPSVAAPAAADTARPAAAVMPAAAPSRAN